MFEGDSADTFAGKYPLVSMGGWAEGLACADPGARAPIGASGNIIYMLLLYEMMINLDVGKNEDVKTENMEKEFEEGLNANVV